MTPDDPTADAENCIGPYSDVPQDIITAGGELDMDGETVRHAIMLADAGLDEGVLTGKSPTGVVAAALYAASLYPGALHMTQDEVTDHFDVSEPTVRSTYQTLLESVGGRVDRP